MTIMSIYRSKMPVVQWDLQTVYLAVKSASDLQLVRLAFDTGKPVLVGIDGEHTICKTADDGDEAESFESLYDRCYTLSDVDRMAQEGVTDPADIPLTAFRLEVGFDVTMVAGMAIALLAENAGDARAEFRRLFINDETFRERIYARIVTIVAAALADAEELAYIIRDCTSASYQAIDPPLDPKGEQSWRLLDE